MFVNLALVSFDILIVAVIVFVAILLFRIKSPRVKSLLFLIVLANGVAGLVIGAFMIMDAQAVPQQVYHSNFEHEGQIVFSNTVYAAPPVGANDGQNLVRGETYVFYNNLNPFRDLREWSWLLVPWTMGLIFLTFRRLHARWSMKRLIRKGQVADVDLRARVLFLASKMGIRRPPKTVISTGIDSPALMGTFRPKIVLPEWMMIEDIHDTKQLDWAIQHELMHYRMRDHWANGIRSVAMILFFFHPAVRWASKRWELHAEQACDDALVHSPFEAKAYASQLYHLLVRMQLRRVDRAMPALYASRTQVKARVEKLLGDARWRRRRPGRFSKIAIALFALVVLLSVAPVEGARRNFWKVEGNHIVDLREWTHIGEREGDTSSYLYAYGQFGFDEAYRGLSSGAGRMRVSESRPGQVRMLRIFARGGDNPSYQYKVNGVNMPFDDDAKRWSSDLISHLLLKRFSGLAVPGVIAPVESVDSIESIKPIDSRWSAIDPGYPLTSSPHEAARP